jgi:hypothetical protein
MPASFLAPCPFVDSEASYGGGDQDLWVTLDDTHVGQDVASFDCFPWYHSDGVKTLTRSVLQSPGSLDPSTTRSKQ